MTFDEAAHQFKIPIEDLKAMQKEGLISNPLCNQEINNISFLSYFWCKSIWLKRQLGRMNKKARLALVRTADCSPVASYIFNRYYNAGKGERLFAKQIASEVNAHHDI